MTRSPFMPSTLPPPYTSSGTRALSLRKEAKNFTTTSELLVGSKPTRFMLHTTLLTSQSPFFRAALNGAFLESQNQSIALPDIAVETFELCVTWLYTGDIKPVPFKDEKPAYYRLLHLWILADRLCLEGLRNKVLDLMSELADRTNSVLTPSDTRILYEQISDTAPIRRLVLDLFAFKKTEILLQTHLDRWHAGFLRDLVVLLKRPCEQSIQRHSLRMWIPESWGTTRACDVCRGVLHPRYGAVGCEDCGQAWCLRCVREGVGMAGWEDGRRINMGLASTSSGARGSSSGTLSEGDEPHDRVVVKGSGSPVDWESCKPWRGARCRLYHEHRETEACGEPFIGH